MNCPACAAPLTQLVVGNLIVDLCRAGCGGIWFDNFELNRVDDEYERWGEALAKVEFNPLAAVLPEKRPCPKCMGITMLQHKFSREKPVVVDECPNCGGVWLDGGELAEIRRPAETQAQRTEATQKFFNTLLATELAHLKARRAQP
ncbi:MAG TPA: zf-TFIIB domain-containing protein [Methylomirabilota bacterium]|nr:zf-TFIIB domain-containing protein [Methylomirabilota bacterium]